MHFKTTHTRIIILKYDVYRRTRMELIGEVQI